MLTSSKMQEIVLDLPTPPSVNKTRRYDWRHRSAHAGWLMLADRHMLARGKIPAPIKGPYQVHITMQNGLRIDLDNGIKALIDFLHRIALVPGDSPRYLRKITVEWGHAPEGVRVKLEPMP